MNASNTFPLGIRIAAIITRFAALGSVWAGGMVLFGWSLGIGVFTSITPSLPRMVPNTALGFTAAGIALWLKRIAPVSLRNHWLAQFAAGLTITIGLLTTTEYVGSIDLGIDSLMFGQSVRAELPILPGRPAFTTAVALVLLGLALVLLDVRPRHAPPPAHFFALLGILIALLALIGYTAGVRPFYGIFSAQFPTGMAFITTIVITMLGAGIVCARPDHGLMAILLSRGADGVVARALLLVPALLPCVTGILNLEGLRRGWYRPEVGGWFFSLSNIAIFTLIIWWVASVLRAAEIARRLAAHRLQESAARIQDLYDNAPCGYHSVGPDGVVLAMNQTELKWLGYSADELIGRLKIADLVTPGDRETYHSTFAHVREQGSIADVELELVRKDGFRFPVLLSSTSIRDRDGRYVMSRTTLTDLTERKRAEAEVRRLNSELEARVLERTSELAEANRELQQKNDENEMFVYSVSHDLRSPLVNLQGFSAELEKGNRALAAILDDAMVPQEIRQKANDLLGGKMSRSLGFIAAAVKRLDLIISALLRLSRAGRIEYRWESVNVAKIVGRILDSMQIEIAEKSVSVTVGELPTVWGDITAVEQVFANLIGNAITYLDPRRAGRIEVGYRGDSGFGDGSAYFIRDNGLGIAEAHRAKIFQVFQRAHPGIGTGEGIGLAIVARVAERHRGRVWVESQVGQGSTFYVALRSTASLEVARQTGGQSNSEQKP